MAKQRGSKGQGMGHGRGAAREGQDGEIGQHQDATHDDSRGRSELSPGHLKKDAGERSARDFAPGRTGRTDKLRRGSVLPEAAPAELGEG